MPCSSSARWLLATLLFAQDILGQSADAGNNMTTMSNSTGGHSEGNMHSTHPASGGGHISHADGQNTPDSIMNWDHARGFAWTWIIIVVSLMLYTAIVALNRHIRKVSCLNTDSQRYFNDPNALFGMFKKHVTSAPLLRKRHHRELMIGKKINMGSIPNRAQTIFVVGYVTAMLVLTFIHIDYSKPERYIYSYLMKRSGTLAVFNLLPLFLLSGRNNPLITLCGISFDTYNLIHRWVGRTVLFEALLHTIVYITKKVHAGGWAAIKIAERSAFVQQGTTAAVAAILLVLTSPAPLRKAFYETFLHVHQALAIAFIAALWFHTAEYSGHRATLKGVIAIWAIERGIRLLRLLVHNVGNGGTTAEVSILPGDAVQIKMKLARPWHFTAGQHAYLYIPRVGMWTSHPFSVAWCDEEDDGDVISDGRSDIEKESLPGPVVRRNRQSWLRRQTNIYFIVRKKKGFTGRLWNRAATSPNGVFTTKAFAEGPYNEQKLGSYGTVILFAAGVGITHSVPHMKDLVQGYGDGTVATRKVILVWILQSPEHLEWIRDWMTQILGLPHRREVLKILLYVSRPQDNREIYSPSSSVQVFPGKPDIQSIVDEEVTSAIGAIGVSVCGVGAMADEVRYACRTWMGKVNIDFEEESFSW